MTAAQLPVPTVMVDRSAQRRPQTAAPASISTSIEVARVALVIGLVFLHYFAYPNSTVSPFVGLDPTRHQVATFINSFVLFFFFSAVPLLSTISGWLFFGFTGEPTQEIRRRIRGRVRSLFLPLLAWNLAVLLMAIVLHAVAPRNGFLPALGFDFTTASALDYVNAVLGLTGLPIALQFWFVRDLFVTVLVSPLLWLMLRKAPLAGALSLGFVWLAGGTLGIFIRTDVLFFFYLGALLRQRGTVPQLSLRLTVQLLVVYAVLMALRALAPLAWGTEPSAMVTEALEVATRMARPLGVIACWGACLHLAGSRIGRFMARYGGFAFFLHAAHYPLIAALKYALWRLVPLENDGGMLANYLASVVLTLTIAAFAAVQLNRLSPALYRFLAGGRSLP
jgi:succinoglycan biosynthesis protein ExoH